MLTSSRGESCELNSIMGLLALCLACGDTATLTVEGPDEVRAADRIADLLETEYDFPQKKWYKSIVMYPLGWLLSNEKIVAKMGNKMNEGMIGPYRKVVDAAAGKKEQA